MRFYMEDIMYLYELDTLPTDVLERIARGSCATAARARIVLAARAGK